MSIDRRSLVLSGALGAAALAAAPARPLRAAPASTPLPAAIADPRFHRRAIEALIWSMPAVNLELMVQAMLTSTAGRPNQLLYWSRLLDWKCQTLTPNSDVIYLKPFWDLREVGPLVIEIPPAGGGVINGTLMDAWQAPFEDVGPAGLDGQIGLLQRDQIGQLPVAHLDPHAQRFEFGQAAAHDGGRDVQVAQGQKVHRSLSSSVIRGLLRLGLTRLGFLRWCLLRLGLMRLAFLRLGLPRLNVLRLGLLRLGFSTLVAGRQRRDAHPAPFPHARPAEPSRSIFASTTSATARRIGPKTSPGRGSSRRRRAAASRRPRPIAMRTSA